MGNRTGHPVESNIDFIQKVGSSISSTLPFLHYFEAYIGLYSALFIPTSNISTRWLRTIENSLKVFTILNLMDYCFYLYSMTLYINNH